jgi:hypothetical protein
MGTAAAAAAAAATVAVLVYSLAYRVKHTEGTRYDLKCPMNQHVVATPRIQ